MSADRKETIEKYVKESTLSDPSQISHETMLFQDGYFDSMGFMMLIDYLEEQFGVQSNDEDLVEENFESINAISDYITRKTASK